MSKEPRVYNTRSIRLSVHNTRIVVVAAVMILSRMDIWTGQVDVSLIEGKKNRRATYCYASSSANRMANSLPVCMASNLTMIGVFVSSQAAWLSGILIMVTCLFIIISTLTKLPSSFNKRSPSDRSPTIKQKINQDQHLHSSILGKSTWSYSSAKDWSCCRRSTDTLYV